MTRFGLAFACGEQRLHDEAGAEDEARQRIRIGLEILERRLARRRYSIAAFATAGAMRRIRRGSNGLGISDFCAERMRLAAIGARHDVGRRLARERGDRLDGRGLHRLVDRRRAAHRARRGRCRESTGRC